MNDDSHHWHLDKRLSVGQIMTSVILLTGIVGVYTDNQAQHLEADKRIAIVETQQLLEHDSNQAYQLRMNNQLKSIDGKLDRLIERELNKGPR